MHYPGSHRHGSKRPEHLEQATLALKSVVSHTWYEQRSRICSPGTPLADEGRSEKLYLLKKQKPLSEHPSFPSGGTKKRFHQT